MLIAITNATRYALASAWWLLSIGLLVTPGLPCLCLASLCGLQWLAVLGFSIWWSAAQAGHRVIWGQA